MIIGSISQKLFGTKMDGAETNHSRQTNPFGVNFKGNMITADVFETKKSDMEQNRERNKFFQSIMVGSMNSFNSISRRFNSVVSFGRRVKESTSDLWNQANNIEINPASIGNFIKSNCTPSFAGRYSVNSLKKQPVADLENMLSEELASVGEN